MTLFTIGFTKKSAEQFFGLLESAGVRCVLDVRLRSTSQLAGFSKSPNLAYFLQKILGVDQVVLPDCAPTTEMLAKFRNCEISWVEYQDVLQALLKERRVERGLSDEILDVGCLLCSEENPGHCHRRVVAEYIHQQRPSLSVEHL